VLVGWRGKGESNGGVCSDDVVGGASVMPWNFLVWGTRLLERETRHMYHNGMSSGLLS